MDKDLVDLSAFNEQEAEAFYNKNVKTHAANLLGPPFADIVHCCTVPKTLRAVAAELNVSYDSVRRNATKLYDQRILIRSDYRSKVGRVYATNYTHLLKHIASTPTGQMLLKGFGVTVPKEVQFQVNRNTIYSEFPEPRGYVLPLKLGTEPTNFFKVWIASHNAESRLAKMFFNATSLLVHVWHRNYLQTEEGYNTANLPSPTASEARACIRGISAQIRQYANLLDQVLDDETLWSDSPAFESWRVIGDIPLEMAKRTSAMVSTAWIDGVINVQGRPGRLQQDYETYKDILDRDIKERWAELNQEEPTG